MAAGGRLDGIILDNRLNDGGVLTELDGTLSYFTHGVTGYFINRQSRESLHILGQDLNGSQETPLVVLTGPRTVSFGEVFAGILQDMGRATLIGEATSGNVEILWEYSFSDHSRAWIAHDTFAPINHPEANWEGSGIIPDQVVAANWDEVTLETDPVIATALLHFDHLKP
jgi:C-terminal processing protease CtpA/Prc